MLAVPRGPFTLTILAFLAAAGMTPANDGAGATGREVKLLRVPEGGIQPQAVADSQGTAHLVYFKGPPAHGNVFYARSTAGTSSFSKPLRVNSQEGSAVAVGTIRGAHMAVGRGGRVHVAWNGSHKALPAAPGERNPMLYGRLNDAGTAFEPQRNVIQRRPGLDGGGSVAADESGNVYVAWHAPDADKTGEANRKVWVARSTDDGKTFAAEVPASARPTGACGCCGLRAFADRKGTLYILYRAAESQVNRDMYLLTSSDRAETFTTTKVHPWQIGKCVMSSAAFAEGPGGILGAWETRAQVYFARLDPGYPRSRIELSRPLAAPGHGNDRKHPVVAFNNRGEMLLAWTEGTGWKKGGAVLWQLYDKRGKLVSGAAGRVGGVPVWSLAAVFPRPDGSFVVLY